MATVVPPVGTYHRVLGFHAPARNRLVAGATLGLAVGVVVALVQPWQVAVLLGWDVGVALVLGVVWHLIARADPARSAALATLEDETRNSSRLLILGASVASLVGVGFALHRANHTSGGSVGLVAIALLTVVLSWTLVNTVFTLHYAHLVYRDGTGLDLNDTGAPDFRDFAYLAFTIGMTYQVSDTALTTRSMRHTALRHALLSYLFGVVIVAMTINLIAGFL